MNQIGSVSIETRLQAAGFNSRRGQWWDYFPSPPPSDRLWGQPASYTMGTEESFPWSKAAEEWSWPFASAYCRSKECLELYIHFSIRLNGIVFN